MPVRILNIATARRVLLAGTLTTACLFFGVGESRSSGAQEKKQAEASAKASSNADLIARGQYLVEDVAVCGNCHSPRGENGELDHARRLEGAPLFLRPARPIRDWPIVAPRLAGLPPANDAAIITLLTTGIWTNGKPLRQPMPRFHMTQSDAEAVLAYLKSL